MSRGTDLSNAIGLSWAAISKTANQRREDFDWTLLPLLRRLELDPEDVQAYEETVDTLTEFGVWQQVRGAMQRMVLVKGVRTPAMPARTPVRCLRLPVLYTTDRAEHRGPDTLPGDMFGGDRGDLSYGIAEISIPDDPRLGKDNPHRRGRIERPRWWRLEFREDPQKHVVVLDVRKLAEADFVERARLLSRRTDAHEALIFVHGYRTGFADALRRTAQIAYDLQFGGVPILFSWPSEAATIPYTVDETNALDSRPRFRNVLKLVQAGMDLGSIHLISHSMGGRLVAEALSDGSFDLPTLNQLVFAAPDIDAKTFKDLADRFKRCAGRVTLYVSNNDKALQLSRTVHKYPRAGEAGIGLVVLSGLDTIDVSAVDTSFEGHGYFGDNRTVISDLINLIQNGLPPENRGLGPDDWNGLRFWRIVT